MREPEGIRKEFREPLVAQLKRHGAFGGEWIERALLRVPRHLFVRRLKDPDGTYRDLDRMHHTDDDLRTIYSDAALLIHDPPSSTSQPWLMAQMLASLHVRPGMKVLEIGTGSGWNAALLAVGTGDPTLVHSIDIQPDLVAEAAEHLRDAGVNGVRLRAGDGAAGWPDAAPFDRIIATAGCPDIAPAWLDQLAEDGVLLLPFSTPGCGDPVLALHKRGGTVAGGFVLPAGFMKLQGALGAGSGLPPPAPKRHVLFRTIRIPGHHPNDLAFFLRGSPWCRPVAEEWLEHPVRWRLTGARGDWSATYDFDRRTLVCSGRPGALWNLLRETHRWLALGRPKLTDYRAEVSDAEPDPSAPADWIDARPNVRLRISLRP